MVQEFPAEGAKDSFTGSVLPWRVKGRAFESAIFPEQYPVSGNLWTAVGLLDPLHYPSKARCERALGAVRWSRGLGPGGKSMASFWALQAKSALWGVESGRPGYDIRLRKVADAWKLAVPHLSESPRAGIGGNLNGR